MNKTPPISPSKWATRLLRWYCPDVLLEEIEGDLLEAFYDNQAQKGLEKARLRYCIDIIRFCNPTTFQRARMLKAYPDSSGSSFFTMLKNYFRIILRTIRRRPAYAALNISGLTLGVAATLFILLYLHFELNYDRFHQRADEVYRISTAKIETKEKVMEVNWAGVPGNLGPLMQQDFPEVKTYVRHFSIFQDERVKLQYGEKTIEEPDLYLVDSSVFDVFTFDLLRGDVATALRGPNKIVISHQLARQLFGEEDPLGKIIKSPSAILRMEVDTSLSFVISGVFADIPENTHWQVNALLSAETDPGLADHYFNRFSFSTYVILHPGSDPVAFGKKLSGLYDTYLDSEREPVLKRAIHTLVPLASIHLEETGGMIYIYIFSGVGLLLLLIAAISYVNLATAQASKRSLEVGLRKVLGSHRRQLIWQFLAESLVFTVLAAGLGILIVELGVPPINAALGLHLDASQLTSPALIGGILSIVFLLGIIGGSYPAFFLSGFEPLTVLKGAWATEGRSRLPVRKILVAVQFAVVIFVLICTGMIYDQLQYIRQKEMGFDKEHLVQLTLPAQDRMMKGNTLRQALERSPWIESVTRATFIPGAGMLRGPISVETPDGPVQNFAMRGWVDTEFWGAMDIEVIEGRNFSPNFSTDTTKAVLINEMLVQEYGLTDPIGTKIRLGDQFNPNFYEVVGVVKDFHQRSLHTPILPQTIFLGGEWMPNMLVKVGGDLQGGMEDITTSWNEVFPQSPLAYRFVDEMLQESYETDQIRGKVFVSFSLITIFIAFLGLFGLASYLAEQRIKEVGIRKVLGAGMWDVVRLLTRDFLLWVVIAAVPAFVLAWYIVRQWLENFAFRTEMNYVLFGSVLLLTLAFTFLITGIHALRAARMNPADTLRGE